MSKSVGVTAWFIGLFASVHLLSLGCGGPTWPRVRPVTSQQFVAQSSSVRTIDVMPVDVQLWTYHGNKMRPQTIAREFSDASTLMIDSVLGARGYYVASNIDWDGNYVGYNGRMSSAMRPEQLAQTLESLSSYGTAVRQARGRLLQPHLPYRLGGVTQSDATLYVGGWAYVGKPVKSGSTAENVVKGVLIALVVVLIVAVIIAAIAGGKGKGGGGLGRLASGTGKVAKGVGQVAVHTARIVGKAGIQVTRAMTRGVIRGARALGHSNISIDIYNRPRTHWDYCYARPNYFAQKATPRRGPSRMMVEMLLIDNRTGEPLWYAAQRFPADATNRKQLNAVFHTMLATMPAKYRAH